MKTLVLVIAAMLVLSVAAVASPIPGSLNEIINGDFETGSTNPWQVGAGLSLGIDGPGHNYAIYCKDPSQSLLLRQVVDESQNTLWDWYDHAKFIDLTLDIRLVDSDAPMQSGVRFGLDWWDESFNSSNTAPTAPPSGIVWTNPILFKDIVGYQNDAWVTVNPFNSDGVIFRNFQPRWVSVEIELIQAPGEFVWVDNVILTSRCVPEPMSVMLGALGLGAVGTFRRIRRK